MGNRSCKFQNSEIYCEQCGDCHIEYVGTTTSKIGNCDSIFKCEHDHLFCVRESSTDCKRLQNNRHKDNASLAKNNKPLALITTMQNTIEDLETQLLNSNSALDAQSNGTLVCASNSALSDCPLDNALSVK
jgi:hypothetical protein